MWEKLTAYWSTLSETDQCQWLIILTLVLAVWFGDFGKVGHWEFDRLWDRKKKKEEPYSR